MVWALAALRPVAPVYYGLAGAPAIAGGAALVTHGGTVAGVGALEEGRLLGNWLFSKRTDHGDLRHSQGNRPTGQAWNDAQGAGQSDVFLDTETGYFGVQGRKGRIHLFTQIGDQLKNHTSFVNAERNTLSRFMREQWRRLSLQEYEEWQKLLDNTLGGN